MGKVEITMSKSAEQTEKLGRKFAEKLFGKNIVALYGQLGSGKSVFSRGLAKGLGIKAQIISPTFVFMRSYPFSKNGKKQIFYHLDLYRGEKTLDFQSLGLDEIFAKQGIVVIEWANKLKGNLPKNRIDIYFETLSENERKITVKSN